MFKNLIFIADEEQCENMYMRVRHQGGCYEKSIVEWQKKNKIIFDGDNRNVILHVKQSNNVNVSQDFHPRIVDS